MPRGRPTGSKIRQNMIEILHYSGQLHGYSLYTAYKELFPKVTMRSIYYHLKKGAATRELKVAEIRKEQGHYSWGAEVERIYYTLGPNARPIGLAVVKEYFEKAAAEAGKQK